MIIGHYHPDIWAKGGIATYIHRISTAQRAAGHTVYLFSRMPYTEVVAVDAPVIVTDDADLFRHGDIKKLDILHLHQSIATAPPGNLPVIRTLHGHQPYCPSGSRYLGRWSKPCDRAYNPVGCLWGHMIDHCGSIRPHILVSNFQQTQQERTVLSQIPVITVSHFLKEQMLRTGYAADLIHVLHLFAPTGSNDEPPPQTDVPHFVFLGRIAPQKGVPWLLRALQQVNQPIHLNIAGEGDEKPKMQILAEKLGLRDRVTFHGWVNSEQVNHLIRSARALIFPSTWHEPGGTVAFEAMANARPVIMSRVGGMPEVVIQGANGLLVAPNNVHELATSIECLATDWEMAMKLGAEGKRMASQQYTLAKHMGDLMHLYEHVIRRKGR